MKKQGLKFKVTDRSLMGVAVSSAVWITRDPSDESLLSMIRGIHSPVPMDEAMDEAIE